MYSFGPSDCAGEKMFLGPAQSAWTEASHGLAISHDVTSDNAGDKLIWYSFVNSLYMYVHNYCE